MTEYPKWLRAPGQPATLVQNADAEVEQLKAWGVFSSAEPSNPLLSQLDHDQDGEPGGSAKGAGDDLPALRIAYKEKLGKRAFPGWNAAEVKARLEAAE